MCNKALAVYQERYERGKIGNAVDPCNTSRTCSVCGHADTDNRNTQSRFAWVVCGYTAQAQVNAARTMLRAGEDVKALFTYPMMLGELFAGMLRVPSRPPCEMYRKNRVVY